MKYSYALVLFCLTCSFTASPMEEKKKPRHVSSIMNIMRKNRAQAVTDEVSKLDQNEQDKVPLLQAILEGNTELLNYLLTMKADPNLARRDGIAPIHEAAVRNNPEVLTTLLAAKAAADQPTENGSTALQLAAALCCKDAVRTLVKHGSKIDNQNTLGVNVLHTVAAEGHADVLNILLNENFPAPALSAQTNLSQETPLHRGVKSGSYDMVQKLVEASSPLNIRDALGKTPVMNAVERRQKDIVSYLLDQGADPSVVAAESGDTILHMALPDIELVKAILVHAQFKPDAEQTTGWQNLSRCEIVKELNLLEEQVREMAVEQFVAAVSMQKQVSICATKKCEEQLSPEIIALIVRKNVERNINCLAQLLAQQDSSYATPSFRAQQRHCLLSALLDPQDFQEKLRPLLEENFKRLFNQ